MLEQVWYQNKETQSITRMLWYQTEILNARMPMQAASTSMLMASYDYDIITMIWIPDLCALGLSSYSVYLTDNSESLEHTSV